MYIPLKYQKSQILFRNEIPAMQEVCPFWSISSPLVDYCSIPIIKLNIFMISSIIFIHICNCMGYNQHAHAHVSGINISE